MNSKEYFDIAAITWDKKFHTPELISVIKKLIPKFGLKPGQNILDVGTGTGVLIPHLIKSIGSSGSVTAIDYSEQMVQECKKKYGYIKNVTIKTGNIQEDFFPTKKFDAITCFGVFPHLENKQKSLQRMNEILKQGGKLIIAHALGSEELKAHHKKISENLAHAVIPEKTMMKLLLEKTGFIHIAIKDEPGCYLCITQKA